MHPVFRSGGFRRLCLNVTCNATSMGGDYVLVGWLALEAGGTPAWVGVAFAIYYLPLLLLGVPAGGTADRFDRFRLMRGIELAAAAVLLVFALLFHLFGADLALVLALSLVVGSVRAVQNPVRLSYAYDLVGADQVTAALSGTSLAMRLGMIAGALGLGTLVETAGVAIAFLVMALAHVAARAALGRSPGTTAPRRPDTTPLLRNLAESLAEMRRNRVLLILILVTAAVEIGGVSFLTLLPSLAEERLALGAQGLGWMQAAQSCGGLLAVLVMLRLSARTGVRTWAGSIVVLGLAVATLGAVEGLVPVLLVLAVVSGSIAVWDILTQSMMQLSVPDHLRGRAMGAWVFAIGSAPLGHLEIGLLAASFGTGAALYANGAAVVAVILVALLASSSLRRL